MDKKTVLLASACTLLMMSCSNDAELINVAETTGLQTKAFVGEADFQIVDYAGDKCIQFKNDSVFNAMLWEMNAWWSIRFTIRKMETDSDFLASSTTTLTGLRE